MTEKPQPSPPLRERLRRLDRIAGDLNVVLVIFAIGLATLDLTFLVTQRVIDRLPQMTRIGQVEAPPPPAGGAMVPTNIP